MSLTAKEFDILCLLDVSTFVLGGFPDVLKPGRVLVDGTFYIIYDANNTGSGESSNCFDLAEYISDDKAVIMDDLAVSAYMGTLANAGYDFVGWNTKADGGEMEGSNVVAKIGDTITLPGCTKDNYIFTGWYDGDICVGQTGEEYTVVDDVILWRLREEHDRMDELKKEQEAQQEGDRKEKERVSQLARFARQMELTEEIKEKLIDKVKVYSDNRIEICWKFEAGFPEVDTMRGCG